MTSSSDMNVELLLLNYMLPWKRTLVLFHVDSVLYEYMFESPAVKIRIFTSADRPTTDHKCCVWLMLLLKFAI